MRELLFPALEAAGARSVVEIGSEGGLFTRELARWLSERRGTLTCVDPAPSQAVREVAREFPGVELVEGRSPEALDAITPADAYVLDGDHNYHSVRGELEAIDACCFRRGRAALVVLHDVAWPCARRDQYYAPGALPAYAVHPHAYDRGVTLGDAGTVEGGFRGMGAFAVALHEGGPRNGVLTAVEDFLSGRDDLAFARLPIVFGLGFLHPRGAPWADALAAAVAPFHEHPVLARMEENRLALYLRVLALQDEVAAERAGAAQEHEAAARERRNAEALRDWVGELEVRVAVERARADEARDLARALEERLRIAEDRVRDVERSLLHQVAAELRSGKERLAPRG
ncbi:MAG TPA: class I SAM-dependent methyltransferase, partial [Anaeromyxobacteraceae bacterium]|nr:class I SAM-dependent methyltransferase [Anaeromyxobacteraceae bacterium]